MRRFLNYDAVAKLRPVYWTFRDLNSHARVSLINCIIINKRQAIFDYNAYLSAGMTGTSTRASGWQFAAIVANNVETIGYHSTQNKPRTRAPVGFGLTLAQMCDNQAIK